MAADPDVLTGASSALRTLAAELEETGREIAACAASAAVASWTGSASLAFEARTADTRRALNGAARELHEVASATARYAAEAADAEALRRWSETRSPRALSAPGDLGSAPDGPPRVPEAVLGTDPSGLLGVWPVAEPAASAARLRGHALELRRVLAASDPCAGLPSAWLEVREAADATGDLLSAAPALAKVRPTAAYWSALPGAIQGPAVGDAPNALASIARNGASPGIASGVGPSPDITGGTGTGTGVAAARRERMAQALDGLRGGRPLPGIPQLPSAALAAARRLSLAAGTVDAARDALTGDPTHPGWRDVLTRAAGAAGALGGGALLVGVSSPIGAGVAATAVTGYGLWKLGTAIWDHRHTVGRAWSTLVETSRGLVLRGISRVRLGSSIAADQVRVAASRLHDAATRIRTAGEGAAREAGRAIERTGEATTAAGAAFAHYSRQAPDAPFGPTAR